MLRASTTSRLRAGSRSISCSVQTRSVLMEVDLHRPAVGTEAPRTRKHAAARLVASAGDAAVASRQLRHPCLGGPAIAERELDFRGTNGREQGELSASGRFARGSVSDERRGHPDVAIADQALPRSRRGLANAVSVRTSATASGVHGLRPRSEPTRRDRAGSRSPSRMPSPPKQSGVIKEECDRQPDAVDDLDADEQRDHGDAGDDRDDGAKIEPFTTSARSAFNSSGPIPFSARLEGALPPCALARAGWRAPSCALEQGGPTSERTSH